MDVIYESSELQTSRLPAFMMHENDAAIDSFVWRWRETLNLLESYSSIKTAGSGEDLSFSMHPLVHTWTRIRHRISIRKHGWRAAGSIIALSMGGANYDISYEKLRSHVTAYLGYLSFEYLANMTELGICQTQFRICYLLLNLKDISKLRSLLGMGRRSCGVWLTGTNSYCCMSFGKGTAP